MSTKTHQTAVAVVPPLEAWGPIQAIRERHDRQVHRWPPHINVLYPFVTPGRFEEVVPRLAAACARVPPFHVTLGEFRFFAHGSRGATLWLAPEPEDALVRLQGNLQAAYPECDELGRFATGFTPHLSVGQADSREQARRLRDALQSVWQPISFAVAAVAVLRRDRDTPFAVGHWVRLARFHEMGPFLRHYKMTRV